MTNSQNHHFITLSGKDRHSARHHSHSATSPLHSSSHPAPSLSIIGGTFRGQKLLSPNSPSTHPMGAREKNALFNMASPAGKHVLDLYAGSGALGLEALSRGAASVIFVEKSPKITAIIKQNLAKLTSADAKVNASSTQAYRSSPTTTQIITSSVQAYLSASATGNSPSEHTHFDLILADPPYDHFDPAELSQVAALLAPDGTFILSSPANLPAPDLPNLLPLKSHTYAAARLTLYVKA